MYPCAANTLPDIEGYTEMKHEATKPRAFRLPSSLLERLDSYAERIEGETGLSVRRVDVVKKLLGIGLDHVEGGAPKRSE